MADNVPITAGVGTNVATDDIGGVHHQRLKVGFGVDGAYVDASATNPLPVLVGSDADNTATGTLAAALQTVVLNTAGKSSANIKITNTWVGTITFEGTTDGTIWDPINAVAASTSTPQTTTTVNGSFRLTPASFIQIRVIMNPFTSGTATISMRSSMATGGIFANQILPVTIISNPAEGVVSTVNSTVANLAANAVFTGTAEDVTVYSNIKITIYSSHASATNGASFQQSHDGVLWIPLADTYTIPAVTQRPFSIPVNMKFFRVVYTNGATLTTTFVIQVLYSKSDKQPSSVRPQDSRSNENDFVEVLSYLMGYNSLTDAWNRIGITNAVTGGNENLIDRIKVNAALRMIDNAQPSGSKLVNVTGSQALGMDVNVGTDITTPTAMPAGGVGVRGWLSAIWTKINGSLAVTGTFFQATQPVSGTFFQATQPVSLATNTPDVTDRAARLLGNITELRAATLAVTVTAATGVAATLTLPAVAAQFHYITSIEARLYSTAARTGAATPILVTTTNIPGTPTLTFDTAGAIGTSVVQQPFAGATPIKSLVVNTATTIIAPIVTGGIWRITATYFTGA